jgi:drug/metabolite transporter (DMT)-like permease
MKPSINHQVLWGAYFKLTFTTVVWGISFIATKLAVREAAPGVVVWLRFLIGVVLMFIILLVRKQLALPTGRDALQFALLGFIGVTLHQWLQSTGLVTSQASTTAWIVASIPIFIAMLGWFFLREKVTSIQLAGILLAALGVLLVVSRGDVLSVFREQNFAPGDVLILLSAPNWALFSVLSRGVLKKHSPLFMVFYVLLFGWLFSTLLLLGQGGLTQMALLSQNGWAAVLFLGIFCTALGYLFWYDGLSALTASQAGAFIYLEPLVTAIAAWVVLGEPLSAASLLGGGLILGGVWLVNTYSSRMDE